MNLDTYSVIQKQELTDIHSKGTLLLHKKSGARIVLVENEDINKVFTIGFRTPPEDSTGLPHILEHSVLCGSKNFPAKDPFVELVKGSMNTFLNAMTYPDKTVYPVASCNDKDFQNLMHVYMDAVFYPNIYEQSEIFSQEGWSYRLEDAAEQLAYNGVVYNEMKGAFSSPEGVLDRVILNSLFPDTTYAHESGGDPEVIPELTYEQFLDFHRQYYHPSNSYIYLYGNMDMQEKLEWLDAKYLSKFEAIRVDSAIQKQKAFDELVELELPYSISEEESEKDNTYLSYNKVIGTSLDKELVMAFQVLDYVLLSAPGAPLKKALLDAKIGKDIMGGYDDGIYQPMFSVVAKNANLEQKADFVKVIEDTLQDLVDNKIDSKALEAGINYHEFRYREADFGNYPKGLMYGLEMFGSWLYDDEKPFLYMEGLSVFAFLKDKIGTKYYEDLIAKYLLHNLHGSLVNVIPEQGRTAKMEKELATYLKSYQQSLSKEEVQALVTATKELEAYQEEPSSEEALAKIPLLKRSDISKDIEPICNEEIVVGDVPLIYHEVETNGIGYAKLLFHIEHVSTEDLPYVGILQAVLGLMDTQNYEYGALFDEINVHTGGIGTAIDFYPDVKRAKDKIFKAMLEMKGKALYAKLPVMFQMMEEILTKTLFDDEKRLLELLDMLKSRLQMHIQSAGHTAAALRAASYASPLSQCKDITSGIAFYEMIQQIVADYETGKGACIQRLQHIAKTLFTKKNFLVSYTGNKESLTQIISEIEMLQGKLHDMDATTSTYELSPIHENEGLKTASKVQYVARNGNYIDAGYEYTGTLQTLRIILGYDYLWQNVRVKGGAYGCMTGFNRIGEGFFVSYRDPNLRKTNETYEKIVDYIKNFEASERDMDKYIIGTISNIDHPLTPMAAGERSMNLYLNQVTESMIRSERKQILEATKQDIQELAGIVQAVLDANQFCVIGNESEIEKEQALFDVVKSI